MVLNRVTEWEARRRSSPHVTTPGFGNKDGQIKNVRKFTGDYGTHGSPDEFALFYGSSTMKGSHLAVGYSEWE